MPPLAGIQLVKRFWRAEGQVNIVDVSIQEKVALMGLVAENGENQFWLGFDLY
jgi:hypothetical protein